MSRALGTQDLRILTIGYEGASVEGFLQTLKASGVTQLLDVRELPLSRRKGFSKNALASMLILAGIGYPACPRIRRTAPHSPSATRRW